MSAAPASPHVILVVEDEPMVRSFMVEVLRRSGYVVLEAGDGETGLALVIQDDAPLHALITDVRLPGMSGTALVRRAREARPGLPALYVTGYAGDDALVKGSGDEAPCLAKPFRAAALLASAASLVGRMGA